MKVFLTGGSGFIGRNFIEKYQSKYEIFAPASSEVDLTKIREVSDYFADKRFDAVVHAAGKCDGYTGSVVEADNLVMFKNVQYEAILHGVKKLIVIGDAADFDRSKQICEISESAFGNSIPQDAYGLGRYLITLLASKDKISTVLRFFSVYGKYADPGTSKTTELIARAVTGKKTAEIERDKTFSAVYVDDAVKVIAAFLDNDFPKGEYNVASDKPLTWVETAKTAKRLAAKDGRVVEIKVLNEGQDRTYTANVEKLKALLPKLRFTSHATGIKNVYEYLMKHKSQARPKKRSEKVDG